MKYESDIAKVIHEDATIDFNLGFISEARMREYDEMCLVKEPETSYAAEKPPKTEYAAASH